MKITVWLNTGLLLFFLLLGVECRAEQRHALVIGNGDYAKGALINAKADAVAVSEALTKLGYDVQLEQDVPDLMTFMQRVDAFVERLSGQDVGLFYYAGHAVQVVGEGNYLMPVSAEVNNYSKLKYLGFPLNYLIDQMKQYKPKLSLVVLDSCRDNPYPKPSRGGAVRGMGRVNAPSDMIIAFATEAGEVANDGDGQHSPYTEALLQQITENAHIPVERFFNHVGVSVEEKTQKRQSPRIEMSPLHYSLCLAECSEDASQPVVVSSPENAVDQQNKIELNVWKNVSTSHLVSDYQVYLDTFPQGLFVDLAKQRIAEINAAATPKVNQLQSSNSGSKSPGSGETVALQISYPADAVLVMDEQDYSISKDLILSLPHAVTPFYIRLADGEKIYGQFEVLALNQEISRTLFGRANELFKKRHIQAALEGAPVRYTIKMGQKEVIRYTLSLINFR